MTPPPVRQPEGCKDFPHHQRVVGRTGGGVTTITAIAKRELKAYFVSPLAYVYLVAFLTLVHWLFLRNFFLIGEATLRGFFQLIPWVYLFFIPAISMGKWAEEKKAGTIEFLFTLPISKKEVVIGKFLAGMGLIAMTLILTFPLPITLAFLSDVDWGPVVGGYLGLLLLGGAYLAIGLWISSLTDNQIIAFILSVVACFALFIIGEPIVTTGLPPFLITFLQLLSLGNHFEAIGRGVIDSRDLIYYSSILALFLFLNWKALEGKEKKEGRVMTATLLIGLLTFNFLATRHFLRVDLTRQKIFTLAKATKDILKNLDDVVTVRVYFTKDLPPALMALGRDVDDLLGEFRNYAGGKMQIEVHNPQENPVDEQKVQMMGIPPIEVNVIKKDKQELVKVYLGMTVHHEAKQEIIPVIQSTRNLEYELASAIIKIVQKERPRLGWWGEERDEGRETRDAGLGEKKESFNLLLDYLKKRFDVRIIDEKSLSALNPKEVPALFFIVPSLLSPESIQAFQNYLDQGGKALLFIDRVAVDTAQGIKPEPKENPLEELLKTFGATLQKGLVLDQSSATATFTGGVLTYHIPYPFWVQILPENFAAGEPFVSSLNSLVLPWTSSIKIEEKKPEGVTIQTLFQTTARAVSNEAVVHSPALDPQTSQDAFAQGTAGTYPLGVLIGRKNKQGPDTKLMVVGNTRMLQDDFLQRFQENLIFLENAVDIFTTGDQLIQIRGKAVSYQPIGLLSDGVRNGIKMADILIGPFLLGGMALTVYWRRGMRARQLKKIYA